MITKQTIYLLLFCLVSLSLNAQEDTVKMKVDKLFRAFQQDLYPGAGVGMLHNGEVQFTYSYGKSNIEKDVYAGNDVIYHLGDLSLQFTSVAILKLMEQGKLDLKENIGDILPAFPEYEKPISIIMLLNQTSGLPAYPVNPDSIELVEPNFFQRIFGYRENYVDNEDVLEFLRTKPKLAFQPGTNWRITNTNYALLASVISIKSGMSYKSYIENELFAPAGLTSAHVPEKKRLKLENYARGYTATADSFYYNPENRKNKIYGCSGIYLSVPDYLKWLQALDEEKVISKASLRQSQRINFFRNVVRYYGYGWIIEFNRGKKYAYHGNNNFGYTHIVLHLPMENIYVVILSNHGALYGIRRDAFNIANFYAEEKYLVK